VNNLSSSSGAYYDLRVMMRIGQSFVSSASAVCIGHKATYMTEENDKTRLRAEEDWCDYVNEKIGLT